MRKLFRAVDQDGSGDQQLGREGFRESAPRPGDRSRERMGG